MDKQKLLELKDYLEDEWDVVNKFELLHLWDSMEYAEEELENENRDIFNRRGKFYVSHDYIKQMTKNADLYSDFWYYFIVLRAESRFEKDAIEYTACSTLFDTVKNGEQVPYYDLYVVYVDEHNGLIVEAERMED